MLCLPYAHDMPHERQCFLYFCIFCHRQRDIDESMNRKCSRYPLYLIQPLCFSFPFLFFILAETFSLNLPASKDCSFETPPSFSVPLKMHNSPESYECYMSCAVTGNPRPHVTWYRNNISLNTNTNYYITNTCGVCSMVILKVGPKDSGDYTVIAENTLGRVECSTKLVVKGKTTFFLKKSFFNSTPLVTCFNYSIFCLLLQIRMAQWAWTPENKRKC